MKTYKLTTAISLLVLAAVALSSCKTGKPVKSEEPIEVITTNAAGKGNSFEITLVRGKAHNHPLMAIWLQDTAGNYIQTLYVAQSIATGVFGHGDKTAGVWQPGAIRRPAALPYWAHKRGIQAPDGLYMPTSENPVPDAYTGATPQAGFIMKSKSDEALPESFDILLEINQPWDWNEFWTNAKYPDEPEYKSSSQPSLIYSARISTSGVGGEYLMKVIGRGHHSGKDGGLYTDLETMSTALNIIESVKVILKD